MPKTEIQLRMRKLKLIWDFRGPAGAKTAAHHEIHLKEYALAKALSQPITGVITVSELDTYAYLVVDEAQMPEVRDALKPHRGQLYEH